MSKYMQLTTKMRPYYTSGLSKAYPRIANRLHFLDAACSDALNGIRLLQGKCRAARKLSIHFGTEPPEIKGNEIPVWLRDGWGENESTVLADARAAGTDSPVSYMCMFPKPVLMTLKRRSQNTRVNSAAEISLDRLFPNFQDADDDRWHSVINRAKSGSEAALQAVDWNDAPEKHPVCSAVISEIGSGKKGKDIRDAFESTTYGWPRDAIDAAFITMFTTEHIRVTHKGVQLKQGQLDQAKISVSDFRVETVTIDARARIKLRKQFQSAGIPCKPNEESSAAGQFLALA